MNSLLDHFTSRGFQERLMFGAFLVLAMLACACTFAHAEELSFDAVAGRKPIAAARDGGHLNVTAIAKAQSFCTCPGCTCKTPHECGDPGCVCEGKNATAASPKVTSPPAGLSFAAISPQRKPVSQAKPTTVATAAKPKRYEWRQVCNGRYCQLQLVEVP